MISLNGKKKFFNCKVYSKDEIENIRFDAIVVATFDEKELAELKDIMKHKDAKVYYLWQS